MTKYNIPDDHEWADEKEPEPQESPATIKRHQVDVILTVDPTEDMGYGREKYTAHVWHDDEDGTYVTHFTKHRWKGNFWRETKDVDWRDTPGAVKQKVAAAVECHGVTDLNPGTRLIERGGKETWRRNQEAPTSEECPACGVEGEDGTGLPPVMRWCPNKGCSVSHFREESEPRSGGDGS